MHAPGVEPGSERWQRSILPLNYACYCISQSFVPEIPKAGKIRFKKINTKIISFKP